MSWLEPFDPQEYSVEFSCYFNVMWTEPRLVIPSKFQEVKDIIA